MRPCWIVPFFVVALAAVVPPPVSGQARAVDVRALAGLAVGLDDTPPYARLGGGTVTVARGPRSRMGVEVLLADLFGPYAVIEKRAALFTAIWEYDFEPARRVNPYLVVGAGLTRHQQRIPNHEHYSDPSRPEFRWVTQRGIHVHGGAGLRLSISQRVFLAPEVRIGLPGVRSTVAVGYVFGP